MENFDVFLVCSRPQIKLNDPDSTPQCINDGDHTAVAVELIPSEIRIVTSVDVVVRHRLCHVLMNLQDTTPRNIPPPIQKTQI